MGDFVCAKHARQHGKLVCPEVNEALVARQPLPARGDAQLGSDIGATLTMTVCGTCIATYGIPLDPADIPDEEAESVELLLASLVLVCPTCFKAAERELGTSSR